MSEQAWTNGPWGQLTRYSALPRVGRIALVAVVALGVAAEVLISVLAGSDATLLAFDALSIVLLALFAWRPPLATVLLIAISPVAVTIEGAGFFGITLAVAAGLVLYCCSSVLILVYSTLGTVWIVVSEFVTNDLQQGGSIATLVIAIVSGIIGHSMRVGRNRARNIEAENKRLSGAADNAISLERERIADELHNIIAHELTVITLQARALPLTQDEAERNTMVEAIGRSSEQALTDVRRMLRIVQDGGAPGTDFSGPASFRETLESSALRLRDLGSIVHVSAPMDISISRVIDTTMVHLLSECTTNVLKHASNSSKVQILIVDGEESLHFSFRNELVDSDGVVDGRSDGGYGLRRMADRVSLLGGTLEIEEKDGWWAVAASVPRA